MASPLIKVYTEAYTKRGISTIWQQPVGPYCAFSCFPLLFVLLFLVRFLFFFYRNPLLLFLVRSDKVLLCLVVFFVRSKTKVPMTKTVPKMAPISTAQVAALLAAFTVETKELTTLLDVG